MYARCKLTVAGETARLADGRGKKLQEVKEAQEEHIRRPHNLQSITIN